jgi:amino acid transporter
MRHSEPGIQRLKEQGLTLPIRFLICVLFISAQGLLAMGQQTGTGAITGRIIDPVGAVVSGATVTATNKATGVKRETQTNDEGAYLPANLFILRWRAMACSFPAAKLHPRFGTPARAIAVQAVLASVLVLAGRFNEIISYFIFVVVIFIALTIAALFVLRGKQVGEGSFRTPAYPATPILFLLLVAVLLFLLFSNNPRQSLFGVGVVLLGVPVYYLLFRSERRKQIT